MRTVPLKQVINVATTIGHLTTSNCIGDIAAKAEYTYEDYMCLAMCKGKTPITEASYLAKVQDHAQLELEGIC